MRKPIPAFLFVIFSCVFTLAQDLPPETNGKANSRAFSKEERSTAKRQKFQGVVRLRVTFLASGEVGEVRVVSGLSDEFNRRAVESARKIEFKPRVKDGKPVSVSKVVEYTFWSPYDENDGDLAKNAEIVKMPAPEHPEAGDLRKIGGKVKVSVDLNADGEVSVVDVSTDLPKEFAEAARKAAAKIKFKPAIHKNGNPVDQSRTIEYEFKPKND
jgi:TonB family protein